MKLFIAFALLLCFGFDQTSGLESAQEIQITDFDEHVLEGDTYLPRDYVIRLPFAHKLLIQIEYVNVLRETGSYLLIKRGPDFDAEGTGILFTGSDVHNEKPILVASDTVLIRLHIGKEPRNEAAKPERKFRITYSATGKATISTTTESPISTSTWPTPGPDDKIHYKIYISGRYDYEYYDEKLVTELKIAISKMAKDYCKDNNIPVKDTITEKNVIINDLIRCPYSWPDSDDCVAVNFAVPVVLQEGTEGYQLLAKHLEMMWVRYNTKLAPVKLKKYEMPDLNSELIWWGVLLGLIIGLLIIGIGIILCIRERCPNRFTICGRSDDKEIVAPIIDNIQRQSVISNLSQYNKFAESTEVIYIQSNGTNNIFRGSNVSSSSG